MFDLHLLKTNPVKHLSIIVPNGENNLSSIVGSYKIFSRANALWKEKGNGDLFKIELVGVAGQVDFHGGLFSVNTHTTISRVQKTDLIIIPSLNHNYKQALSENKQLLNWLVKHYKEGASIASICTGAFLLAATGLLDGKTCSTHWSADAEFRQRFPEINLKTDKLITDEDGIYTNGGAFSFLNLIIYLIEKYYDRQLAIYCAKVFQIDMDRSFQSAFSIFNGHKKHNDKEVYEAQVYLELNYQDKISIGDLSDKLHVGRRNFDRRFISATGLTPLEYLQRVKVEAAKKFLENTRKTVGEIMYDVGYSDTKAFRTVFSRITGVSPNDYKSRYNKGS
ncbi:MULTISPECIES: GlxA family transcriptional regulator [unclassified Imperialibacter]|uniref:GlxA family transcriptional regulator n=1 Tax=unclassified Imperialibacter TaxID=2629706 RepID=UPI001253E2F7|nr:MULTISPECIES: helix-turn-helix domain-containing protein [unclassified Imperialibacter]CAD5254220.1 Transcriptional regulator, AraC family [Imperialibacter sp. 89]CAD5267162.1 Transcriptional regulator, AraC family [Imperialibacter sp. 75]VVT00710.1 Transcriptional regulator, AraC family [Imperialibacter sp. EC-SDR9]